MKIQDGKLVVKDGKAACECCEGDPVDLPPWVCPECPDWGGGPGGPVPPTNPSGTPRCCAGDTICTPTDDEPIYLGIRITGTISNTYTYASGPNAGTPFNYSADFNEVFTYQTNSFGCQIVESPSLFVTVPFRTFSSVSPVDRKIGIGAVRVRWDRERGFFGETRDIGDDPFVNTFSGISLKVGTGGGSTGGPIRGTVGGGYNFKINVCRSDQTPGITPRPDIFSISSFPAIPLEGGTRAATTPSGVCLNRVITEYSNTFNLTGGSGTDDIEILYRFYAFAGYLARCEPI
jgi:hypothetical protein